MKSKISLIIVYLLLAAIIKAQQPDTLTIPPDEFKKQITELKCAVIDVRTPEEFNKGHIAGSQNIDVKADSFNTEINKLDKTRPYLVYCGIGKRGSLAMQKMISEGFVKVYNLAGGLDAWKKKNFETVK